MNNTKKKDLQPLDALRTISALKFMHIVADGIKQGTIGQHDAAIVLGVASFVVGKVIYGESFGEGLGLYIDVPNEAN